MLGSEIGMELRPTESDTMVWIPGGEFTMGSDRHYPEEAPTRQVRVDGFWIDRFTVTNHAFERFVAATGHVTLAERPADAAAYPGAKPEMLVPSSTMFKKPAGPVDLANHYNWWVYVSRSTPRSRISASGSSCGSDVTSSGGSIVRRPRRSTSCTS